jgi:hypothetical protein
MYMYFISTLVLNKGLTSLQKGLFSSIEAQLGLKLTGFTEGYGKQAWTNGELSGESEWWDEAKGGKLTGVSRYTVNKGPQQHLASINGWMGPGYLVPHLQLSIDLKSDSHGRCA